MTLRWTTWVLALVLAAASGCARSAPPAAAPGLPDTSAQLAAARQYLALVVEQRFDQAWQLLEPGRQAQQSPQQLAESWRSRGQLRTEAPYGPLQVWPAAVDEVRVAAYFEQPQGGGARQLLRLHLAQVGSDWRMADEQPLTPQAAPLRAASPVELARAYAVERLGPLWLGSLDVLDDERIEDGEAVVFQVLDPFLAAPGQSPPPAAILVFGRPVSGAWEQAGGGAIGTLAPTGQAATSCAWTWLRLVAGEPTLAAFYCSIEDGRIARVRLSTREGLQLEAETAGRRAVVLPYAWDMQHAWPAQQPGAIQLFDQAGQPLGLPAAS